MGPAQEGAVRPPFCSFLQIVAQKRVSKPLFLKYGKSAGKSTITVSACWKAGWKQRLWDTPPPTDRPGL